MTNAMTIAADAAYLQSSNGALYQNHLLNVQCERLCENSMTTETPKKVQRCVTKLCARLSSYEVEWEETDLLKKSRKYIPTYQLHVIIDPPKIDDLYRNNGYFEHRNRVLWDVAKQLRSSSNDEEKIVWQYGIGGIKKELVISKQSFRIVVNVRMQNIDWIPPIRLVPNRSNLSRHATSIRYNHALSDDFLFFDFKKHLFESYGNARQAFALFQIWCIQRELNTMMEYHDMCAILLFLYRSKRANARQSPLQVLTHVWTLLTKPGVHVIPTNECSESQTIAQCSLAKIYETLSKETPLTANDAPTLVELYGRFNDLAILDSSMRHNYTGHYSASFVRTLQKLAEESLEFDYRQMFLTNDGFWTRYDTYLRIDAKSIGAASINTDDSVSNDMMEKLNLALGDRVSEIRIHKESSTFPISKLGEDLPTSSNIVIGFNVNPDTSFRVVDRGPPSSDTEGVEAFRSLWGDRAELRRFKDGAIVYAVIWELNKGYSNEATWQAGIIKAIALHILQTHFCPCKIRSPSLDNMTSLVDGIPNNAVYSLFTDPMEAHRSVLKAFEHFATLLRSKTAKNISDEDSNDLRSALGLPLAIDAVEPLDPSLRYAALYPPIPHPLLGGKRQDPSKKVAGAICFDPIRIQVRFATSTKWPTELKAIQAAERAMLIELVNGLDRLDYITQTSVTESYADISYNGYVWRVNVRADPEMNFLRGLNTPSAEAQRRLAELVEANVAAPVHHTLVHSVYTKNPSSSAVVRLAKRWLSSHMLQIPFEAIELMVCALYNVGNPPGTLSRGFERWLNLLATHDWLREALIVDPEGLIAEDERTAIESHFNAMRGDKFEGGPPMTIYSSSSRPSEKESVWSPAFVTGSNPEKVVLCRAVALAQRSHAFLQNLWVADLTGTSAKLKQNWSAMFVESPEAFTAYSALLRLKPDFVTNRDASSTTKLLGATSVTGGSLENKEVTMTSFSRSMKELTNGPIPLRRTMFKNLMKKHTTEIILDWNPVRSAASVLQTTSLAEHAIFLFNDLCPEVIGIVWRKYDRRPFSAVTSEYVRPVSDDNWMADTLVVLNVSDVVRGATSVFSDMIAGVKIFDKGPTIEEATGMNAQPCETRKRERSKSFDGGETNRASEDEGDKADDDDEGSKDSSMNDDETSN